MIVFTKGKVLSRCQIWFEEHDEIPSITGSQYDVMIINGNRREISGKSISSEKQKTLISDLDVDIENLKLKMTKTIRNEINRAEREEVKCSFYEAESIIEKKEMLDSFSEMYSAMYAQKNMKKVLRKSELIELAERKCIMISSALVDTTPVVFHSYIFDKDNCRLLHSCSVFRNINSDKNAVGRANKYLHYRDMCWFKKRGVRYYDWGGVHSFDEPNGIDKFKIAFGGDKIEYYNITYRCSAKSQLLNML